MNYLSVKLNMPKLLTTIRIGRIRRFSAGLRRVPPKRFDIGEVEGCKETSLSRIKHCGSVACAVGWCPAIFPEFWHRNDIYLPRLKVGSRDSLFTDIKIFLGIPSALAYELFSGNGYPGLKGEDVTPAMVADHLDGLLKLVTKAKQRRSKA